MAFVSHVVFYSASCTRGNVLSAMHTGTAKLSSRDLQDMNCQWASERRLSFVFESATNNKICGSCNQKNIRLMKRDRDEKDRDEKEDQKIEEAKMARLHERSENASIDCEEGQEKVDMTEKEGTAISVLLYLSKL